MGILSTNLNELSKDSATQFSQIQNMGNDLVNWSNTLPGKVLVDYTEPPNNNNESTNSTDFINLQNFIFVFTPNNPLCQITIHLFLMGEGYIGVYINNLLIGQPIYFSNSSAQTITFIKKYQLSNAKQNLTLKWRSNSDKNTITKVNTSSQPGINSVQISSENS